MKKVIYSAIIGPYDDILGPQVVAEGWDYVMFVSPAENLPQKVGVWRIVPAIQDLGSNLLTARYIKLNPHVVLPEYDWHLWIDGNIRILDNTLYKEADERIASAGEARHSEAEGEESRDYFGLPHPLRDDVAEEILRTHRSGMISYRGAKKLLRFLFKQEGLPRHSGLQEANIILRCNCPAIKAFNELWWEMFQKFPPRDQFTQIYCLRKCGVTPLPLLGEGINARNCPGLEVVGHTRHSDAKCNEAKNLVSSQILRPLRSLRMTRAITRRLLALYIKRL